jgi:N-acetylmuramoyl-L-alanine amidase
VKICIDPGHGGFDPGAIGPSGLREKDITLPVSLFLADILDDTEASVSLTRETDQIDWPKDQRQNLQARCDIANRWKADLFISIHVNSADNPSVVGTEVFTLPGQGAADPIADAIIKAMMVEFPGRKFRTDTTDGDLDKEEKFYVLKHTNMPALLVELAFISNQGEEKLLGDPEYQRRLAAAIAKGIIKDLGLSIKQPELPPDGAWINVGGKTFKGKLINGVVLGPVRDMYEAEGKQVEWDGKTKTVTVS